MEIRITSIQTDESGHENPYVAISHFRWLNESNDNTGTVSRIALYNWITENDGVAYIKDDNENKIKLLAEVSNNGDKYVKTVIDNAAFDILLSLVECDSY
jgi:hypothetical protein